MQLGASLRVLVHFESYMLGLITPKVLRLVRSRCMFGLLIRGSGRRRPTVDARTEGKWAYPLPSLGVRGITPGKFVKI